MHPIVDVVSRYSNDIVPVELAIKEVRSRTKRDLFTMTDPFHPLRWNRSAKHDRKTSVKSTVN